MLLRNPRTSSWLGLAVVFILGCGSMVGCSKAPSAVPVLAIDPQQAAESALAQLDQDQSGDLSEAELQPCAGLLKLLSKLDSDKNGSLSATELAARFRFWVESPTRITTISCQVLFNGRPLEGATVKFVPEDFLGEGVMAGSGRTVQDGTAMLSVPDADLPPALKGIQGLQLGLYRVEITHPQRKIPARYNTESTISQEINPASPAKLMVIKLTNK